IDAADIDNEHGTLQSDASLDVDASGAVNNTEGLVQAMQVSVHAGSLDNTSGAFLQTGAAQSTIVVDGTLTNAGGRIASNGNDVVIEAATVENGSGEIVHAGAGTLEIAASDAFANDG